MSNGGERERVATDVARPGPRQDSPERTSEQELTPQDAGNLAVGHALEFRLPFYQGSDPLAPYTVLREANPTAWALLARTARRKTLGAEPAADEAEEPEFTEMSLPARLLVRPPIPAAPAGDFRSRLWPVVSMPEADMDAAMRVIQEEIVARWATRNAALLDRRVHVRLLAPEEVEPSMVDLEAMMREGERYRAPVAPVLVFDLDGQPLETTDGSLSPIVLDLLGSNDIEATIRAVGDEAVVIGTAGDLLRTTSAFLDSEEAFWDHADSDPDAYSLTTVAQHGALFNVRLPDDGPVEVPLAMHLSFFVRDHPEFAGELSGGLARLDALAERVRDIRERIELRHTEQLAARKEEEGPLTSAAADEVWRRAGEEWEQGEHFIGATDYAGFGVVWLWNSIRNGLTGNFFETQEQLTLAYERGEVSWNELREVEAAAAARGAVVLAVTIALTIATAGLASGVPALTASLGAKVLFAGATSAVTTMTTMTTSTLVTGQQEFENPAQQAAWERGAFTPEQIVLGGVVGFGLGAAIPLGGAALGKLGAWLRLTGGAGPGTALIRTGGGLPTIGDVAPPTGWVAEEVGPGIIRFTHPDVPGQVLLHGETLRIQLRAGTGVIERQIPLGRATGGGGRLALPGGQEGGVPLLPAGEGTGQPLLPAGRQTPLLTAGTSEPTVTPRTPVRRIVTPAVVRPPRQPDVWIFADTEVYHPPTSPHYMEGTGRLVSVDEAVRLGKRPYGMSRAQTLQWRLDRARAQLAAGEGRRSANLERVAMAESRQIWHGTDTPALFARHQVTFAQLADIMDAKAAQLAANGEGDLLPAVNRGVLRDLVDNFRHSVPELQEQWQALSRADQIKFESEIGAREVGARKPDIVEFFLSQRRVVVADVTEDPLGPLHRFKSDFYKAVMERMCGARGPAIWTQDIDPTRAMVGSTPR